MRVGLRQDPQVGTMEKFAKVLGCKIGDFRSDEVERMTFRAVAHEGATRTRSTPRKV